MSVIADKRLVLLKGLIKTLPQASLRSLELALGLTKDEALIEVRELISIELEFRYAREAVFAPYLPLFETRHDGLNAVEFPHWLLDNLWRALESHEPELYQQSRFALRGLRAEDPTPVVFFRLVTSAAAICRDHPGDVLPKSPARGDAEEVAEFAHYLDLHRIVRNVLAKLPDFLGRIDAEKAAALRLMFKDACAISEEGGMRFMEVIFSNLEDGAQIIKFIATVSDRPNDRFLAESELADFGERILERIEEGLADLKAAFGGKGEPQPDAGLRVAQSVGQLQSFSHYIELTRDGPWSKRVAEASKQIAGLVESRLKGAERIFEDTLVMRSERVYGRVKKDVPKMDKYPKPEVVDRARNCAAFVREVRATANAGGFATLHTKTVQALEAQLDAYFEALLDVANGEDPFDSEQVMSFFELVTDLMEALCGEEKAVVGRRRVASSNVLNPPKVA
ncbi:MULTISPECIES: hypothetical protein [Asticcacaulis]|uniref:hypothetical protein n=1 Tax=Asticcacaulis TaxID=76890 RepID=UPI001AE4D295|nr:MULTISPECIES: hypothetical protein [Asticcacaulis]MBP2157777.1 hypothetical protein [Asticcacaulis solisilvae]MDR6798822.1 hypothetical protein [Asticcacaulis sp. BE141]